MAVLISSLGLCYFPVPKVANTSIKHLVYEIEHGKSFASVSDDPGTPKHIHEEYRTPIFSRVDKAPLESFLRFAVVRDPVQRLLSVWRNRVAHHQELSAPKVDLEALAARGLRENPSLDEFIDKLDLYREVQPSVRLHSAPLVDFLGEDPTYFHLLFRMEESHLIEAFFHALTGVHRRLRRSQTGGPKVSIDDVSLARIERIRDFYQKDYAVFGDLLVRPGSGIPRGIPIPSFAAPKPSGARKPAPARRQIRMASGNVRPHLMFRASLAALELVKMLSARDRQALRMLDIGGGHGIHADFFEARLPGLKVDIVDSVKNDDRTVFSGDYLQFEAVEPYDVIWTSHVLEHVRNPGLFLDKVRADLKNGGIFACTVPPHRNNRGILEHVTTWDPMLLIINLVRAGLDASDGHFAKYRYNVSGIVHRRDGAKALLPDLPKQGYTLVADFQFKNWSRQDHAEPSYGPIVFSNVQEALEHFEDNRDTGKFFFVGDQKPELAWYFDPRRAIIMRAN